MVSGVTNNLQLSLIRSFSLQRMGALVLRGGFANKIKSEDVNRAQEKIMKDRL
jgi:hypothetical protein